MHFLENEIVVKSIELAVFFSKEKGTPIQKRRTSHGFVFNLDCWSTYRFETGEVLTCHSGECIYLPKGSHYTAERHMERDSEQRGIYAINFLTLAEEPEGGYQPFVVRVRGKDEMLSLFSKAESAWRKKEIGYHEECFGDLYKIIRMMKKEAAHYSSKQRTLELIAPALEYINESYTKENVTLAHLAALCHISQPYLRRLFHNAFSVSPAVYMRNLRIGYAKELLRSGEYSVTDAAMLSGFNDVAYFSREFKKITGVSPRDYVKSN